ncbi:hypothetical protein GCM10010172_22410 [Paractinoplanes ferrugineus]|uniref:NodB homology domain-containing protein n=1 Tax=Paractinoplanes ferrugineus TaxID=113564 RepID=A0A919IX03_9ACTN|nr:polysaccharide deacetylase family protein [Actinoplanes ferrugineus]GIE08848.1 hypothetical protein Afe05nite_06880 [Actinoplanes ferrugineus]
MSPQSLRFPSPASGDVAEAGGRHRRPESLADSRPRVSLDLPPVTADPDFTEPTPERPTRSARHQRGTAGRRDIPSRRDIPGRQDGSDRQAGSSRPGIPGPRDRTATRPGRHAATHRSGVAERPITGSHRAPGTLPIESWLLMGKTRQQVLLASLVAVGLLLIAIPGARGTSGLDAINAASEGKAGTQAAQKTKPDNSSRDRDDSRPAGAQQAKAPAAPTPSTPAATATGTAPSAAAKEQGSGPGASLRVTGNSTVALTFDDGPDPQQTPKILALLGQYQVKATFCLVGEQVRKHPEIVRQIVAAGHTLCNHTWNHSLTIGKDDPAKIEADLARTNAAIQAAVPGAPIPFFRAPGGNFTDRLVGVAATAGMSSLYWEVDPQDWKHDAGENDAAHTARVIAEVKKHVRPGSIVLSHDFNQPDTIAAYQQLLPWLKQNFKLGIPDLPTPAPTTTAPAPAPSATTTAPGPAPSAGPQPADAVPAG